MAKRRTTSTNEHSDQDNQDFLKYVIGRFDFYIGTTNSKAALLLAFNTFLSSAIVLKWPDLSKGFAGHPVLLKAAMLFLGAAACGCLASLWATFEVVNPFLKSPESPGEYHSNVFFGHVARHAGGEEYLRAVEQQKPSQRTNDFGNQAHAVAQGVIRKFRWMKVAVGLILFVEIPALGGILLLKIGELVFG